MKKQDSKQRLFEVMSRLDKTFKPQLNEWNFDKKKGEDKEEEGEESKEHEEKEEKEEGSGKKKWNFEKKKGEDKDEEHEESETPEEEKEEVDEAKPKIPVNAIAKVGK